MRSDRDRLGELWEELPRLEDPGDQGTETFVAATVEVASYPADAGRVFAVSPVTLGFEEVEGAAPSFAVDYATILFAINLGAGLPPAGTNVIVSSVGGRLAFRYG